MKMRDLLRFASLAALSTAAVLAFAQSDIPVTVNGNPVHFRGQGPVMMQDRVFVPLRGVLERMGARVNWDPSSETVTAYRDKTHVELRIGDRTASINGQAVNLDVPAKIVDGSTMVPLRFVSEALGDNVRWDEQAQTVEIASRDYTVGHEIARRDNDQDRRARRDNDEDRGARPMRMPSEIPAGTIIQATLDENVNSDSNVRGDRIMATVSDNSLGLPDGTKLEGRIQGIRRRSGDRPGWLSLRFTKLVLPNGNTFPVTGTFMGVGKVNAAWIHNAHFRSGDAFGVRLSNTIRFAP